MLSEGGLEAGDSHGEIGAGEREAGFGAEATDGELILRIKSENSDKRGRGGDCDDRVHKKSVKEKIAELIGILKLVFVGRNIATKFPTEAIISSKVS